METGEQSFSELRKRLWHDTFVLALSAAVFWTGYVIFLDPAFTLGSLAKVLAGTSGVLLAASFSLSGLSYYFNIFDSWLVYRKYLGLMGYYVALAYTALVASLDPDFYIYGFRENFFHPDIFLGFMAMAILTLMAFISHNAATRFLGPKLWKQLLGLGYVAYALLIVRAILLEGHAWIAWLGNPEGLPTIRCILSVIGIGVLLLRVPLPFPRKLKSNGVI